MHVKGALALKAGQLLQISTVIFPNSHAMFIIINTFFSDELFLVV